MSTRNRLANPIGASVLAFAASIAVAAAPDADAPYRWNEHVRPAIEAAICVRIEAGNFVPSVTGEADCPVTSDDPTLASITGTIARSNRTLQWLFASKLERYNSRTESAEPARRSAVERDLREMTLRDGRLVHRYMPLVHAVLAESHSACADCPGPMVKPWRREVTLGQLMPYAVRFVWPDAIEGSRVDIHTCAGSNGISELPYPDLDYADAALAALIGNPEVPPILEELVHPPSHDPDAVTERDQLAAIRRDLRQSLGLSPRFRRAVAAALLRNPAGVTCSDCRNFLYREVRFEHANGVLAAQGKLSETKTFIYGYPEPKLEPWQEFLRVGRWRFWYPNGNLRATIEYRIETWLDCCVAGPCDMPYEVIVGQVELFDADGRVIYKGSPKNRRTPIDTNCGGDEIAWPGIELPADLIPLGTLLSFEASQAPQQP